MNTTKPSKAYYKSRDIKRRATMTILKHTEMDPELKQKLLYLLDKELMTYREVLAKII